MKFSESAVPEALPCFVRIVELARTWQQPATGEALFSSSLLQGHEWTVTCLSFSPNGRLLATGSKDQTVRLWSIPDGRSLYSLPFRQPYDDPQIQREVRCLSFSPDGRLLAVGCGDNSVKNMVAHVFVMPDSKQGYILHGHTGGVNCLSFSFDGGMLATGSEDSTVQLWRMPDGKLLQTLVGHTKEVSCLSFSPNGRHLASASRDKTVRVWAVPDGRHVMTLEGQEWKPTLSFSPDGGLLFVATNRTVQLWTVPQGELLRCLEDHQYKVCGQSLSPNGTILASYDDKTRLWSVPDCGHLRTFEGGWRLAFSPDDQLIATVAQKEIANEPYTKYRHMIRLWSLHDGGLLQSFEGPGEVECLSFSPDSQWLATGGRDHTPDDHAVRLWGWPMDLSRLSRLPPRLATPKVLEIVEMMLNEERVPRSRTSGIEFIAAVLNREFGT